MGRADGGVVQTRGGKLDLLPVFINISRDITAVPSPSNSFFDVKLLFGFPLLFRRLSFSAESGGNHERVPATVPVTASRKNCHIL